VTPDPISSELIDGKLNDGGARRKLGEFSAKLVGNRFRGSDAEHD
jgi:hypothetical protein